MKGNAEDDAARFRHPNITTDIGIALILRWVMILRGTLRDVFALR
jgi:hypothetical protein